MEKKMKGLLPARASKKNLTDNMPRTNPTEDADNC
jgi:hypothetical protein